MDSSVVPGFQASSLGICYALFPIIIIITLLPFYSFSFFFRCLSLFYFFDSFTEKIVWCLFIAISVSNWWFLIGSFSLSFSLSFCSRLQKVGVLIVMWVMCWVLSYCCLVAMDSSFEGFFFLFFSFWIFCVICNLGI